MNSHIRRGCLQTGFETHSCLGACENLVLGVSQVRWHVEKLVDIVAMVGQFMPIRRLGQVRFYSLVGDFQRSYGNFSFSPPRSPPRACWPQRLFAAACCGGFVRSARTRTVVGVWTWSWTADPSTSSQEKTTTQAGMSNSRWEQPPWLSGSGSGVVRVAGTKLKVPCFSAGFFPFTLGISQHEGQFAGIWLTLAGSAFYITAYLVSSCAVALALVSSLNR